MQRKIISLSLMFYILILLTQPCQDVFAHVDQTIVKNSAPAMFSAQSITDTYSEEGCSPFCICGCCSLSVAHQTFTMAGTVATSIQHVTRTAAITYRDPYDTTYLRAIWQPPKV